MKILKTLIIFSALAASTPLQAQTSDDSLHVVDEIVITGSRLKIPTHNTAAKIPLPLRNTPLRPKVTTVSSTLSLAGLAPCFHRTL